MTGAAVRFSDIRCQNDSLRDEINAAIRAIIDSSEFCLGSAVFQFEESFATFLKVRHAIAVNSGTSALHLALLALGIGDGDEVITVASTFVATAAAVRYTGARPVFVDIDPDRFTMEPTNIESAITSKTAAIMPVHLYGQVADMDPICRIAENHGLPVIEDAAQAHGATYKGSLAGTLGKAGCFSFYPGKVLGAFGEGGAVVTNDDDLADRVRIMRDWGQAERGVHHYPSFNYRMEGMQGAVLNIKLRRLGEWVNARRQVAETYDRLLADIPQSLRIVLPVAFPDGKHIYQQYAIRTSSRAKVRAYLSQIGIETRIHYPLPVHLQPGFNDLGAACGDLPRSEALARSTLSLPIYPEIPANALERVADGLRSLAKVA
jgi:dTDP-4-amino-4,6-dideoxygalactose transaminase